LDTNVSSSKPNRNWALWAALGFIAVGLAAVLYVLSAASSKPAETGGALTRFAQGELAQLAVMDAAPAMSTRAIQDASGAETNLQAFTGQVLVVNLWATWCAPCVEEMPSLAALQRRYEGRVRIVPVSVDGDGMRAQAQTKLAELSGGALPFLIDITRGLLFDIGAPGMPVTVIYDAQGQEVARLAGGADWSSEEAAALIDAVLAQSET
jgi:thiol-disulfide isomerase/thioredoxin